MAPDPGKAKLDAQFSDLYRAHLRDVYSYAYYRVGNHHDAEDLTEQTFLQAYRHFERAQRESRGRPLRPWLIRIAHNLAANYYRDRSRKPQTPIDDAGVLAAAHAAEAARQRTREVRWGPRTLDVDIISYGTVVSDDPELTLPHPRAHERAFVLVPWHDVDPAAELPGHGPVAGLIAGLANPF